MLSVCAGGVQVLIAAAGIAGGSSSRIGKVRRWKTVEAARSDGDASSPQLYTQRQAPRDMPERTRLFNRFAIPAEETPSTRRHCTTDVCITGMTS